ncbi:MAG TPA: hypothetical protein PKW15_01925 [Alphaproteobacteria bacterium]|nr:hypothetical protein [Rhodospirillaceae bacterium]HRJ11982.1 hypothetical protein [Alphaproteobacteria bacterium]
MANLIITIISIALVAIAAIMGAYYGGAAYLEGQAKARAASFISQGEQIANAWRAWSVDRGGTTALPDYDWTDGSSDLVPAYLTAIPIIPTPDYESWRPRDVANQTPPYVNMRFVRARTSAEVCLQIARMAGHTTIQDFHYIGSGGGDPRYAVMSQPFDCRQDTGNTDEATRYHVVYWAF